MSDLVDRVPFVLKKGDKVYRVREVDPPDDKPHSWEIESRTVKQASDKQITLKEYFWRVARITFGPSALGSIFYRSPEEAVRAFSNRQLRNIEEAKRALANYDRALVWANEELGRLAVPR